MYKIIKLTAKESCVIRSGSSPEIQVVEEVQIPAEGYGELNIRMKFSNQGLVSLTSKCPKGWRGVPKVFVSNFGANEIYIRKGDEIGEVWIFGEG